MEKLTPLQHCAQQLREDLKRSEEEKRQKDKLGLEGRELINKFASSFSSLFSLLISSNIEVHAQWSPEDPVILLTYKNNQISIVPDRASEIVNKWRFFDKVYKATVPNKDFGIASDKTDEHKLIIAIEEKLFLVEPTAKAQVLDTSLV